MAQKYLFIAILCVKMSSVNEALINSYLIREFRLCENAFRVLHGAVKLLSLYFLACCHLGP
jgi:hypothetical protein